MRPPSSSLAGPGRRHRVRSGDDQHAHAAGAAPRAGVADEHVVRGGRARRGRATPWRPPAAVRRGPAARCRAPASGCRVPTSPLARLHRRGHRPRRRPRRASSASRSTRPEPVHRDLLEAVGVAGRGREVAAEGAGRRSARRREATSRAPAAAPGVQQPVAARRSATGPEGRNDSSGGPHAQPGRDHLAGPVQQRARLPPLGVQAARVGPPGVEGGQQRVAGERAAAGPPRRPAARGRRTRQEWGDTP